MRITGPYTPSIHLSFCCCCRPRHTHHFSIACIFSVFVSHSHALETSHSSAFYYIHFGLVFIFSGYLIEIEKSFNQVMCVTQRHRLVCLAQAQREKATIFTDHQTVFMHPSSQGVRRRREQTIIKAMPQLIMTRELSGEQESQGVRRRRTLLVVLSSH